MIEITAEIRALIDKAAAGVELAGDEYIDPADGLIHCKKCGGQRQTVVPCFGKSGYFMPRCICQCQREAEEQRKAAEERQRRMERIKRRKAQGLQDRYLYDYTFANIIKIVRLEHLTMILRGGFILEKTILVDTYRFQEDYRMN